MPTPRRYARNTSTETIARLFDTVGPILPSAERGTQHRHHSSVSWWRGLKQKETEEGGVLLMFTIGSSCLLSFLFGGLLFNDTASSPGGGSLAYTIGWIGSLVIWTPAFFVYLTCGILGEFQGAKRSCFIFLTIGVSAIWTTLVSSKVIYSGIACIVTFSTVAVHAFLTLLPSTTQSSFSSVRTDDFLLPR